MKLPNWLQKLWDAICFWRKPDEPDTPADTPTSPATPTNSDEWGEVIKLRRGDPDLAEHEWRDGSGPQVSILERNADWWLGRWAQVGLTREPLADGAVRLTAKPIQGPSGRWYRPYSWRIKTDNSVDIKSDSCVVSKADKGDVTRLRYECREKLK